MSDGSPQYYLLPAIILGFISAAQPGPLLIFMISRTLQSGWKRTLPAVFAPLLSDGPIALVSLLLLSSLPEFFLSYLQFAGGLFILFLAFRIWMSWKENRLSGISEMPAHRTLLAAVVVNFLNPGPYLGWSLVIGPLFLQGWKENPANSMVLIIAFYLTMFIVSIILLYVFDRVREYNDGIRRKLLVISALAMLSFGVYQIVNAGMTVLTE